MKVVLVYPTLTLTLTLNYAVLNPRVPPTGATVEALEDGSDAESADVAEAQPQGLGQEDLRDSAGGQGEYF